MSEEKTPAIPLRSSDVFLDVIWLEPGTGKWRKQHFQQPSDREGVRCCGWAARMSGGLAALYAEGAHIWLQFRDRRWPLTGPDRVEATAAPWISRFLWRFEVRVNGQAALRRPYLSPVALLAAWNPAYAVTLDALDEECDDFFVYAARTIQRGNATPELRSLWLNGI